MSIALFGGTFDPVHNGHLQMAINFQQALQVDDMRLVPCANPYHRQQQVSSSQHRLAMLRCAIESRTGLSIDTRELERTGPSYTVDTLESVREQEGNIKPLILCMGMDSLLNLSSWHQWQRIIELAHIAVVARPAYQLPKQGPVAEMLEQRQTTQTSALQQTACGLIHILEHSLIPISATLIRQRVKQGLSISDLVPQAVEEYIVKNHLYIGK